MMHTGSNIRNLPIQNPCTPFHNQDPATSGSYFPQAAGQTFKGVEKPDTIFQ